MKTSDIRIRDPYIVNANGRYYLYSATGSLDETTIVVYQSTDLENWNEPTVVYQLDTTTWKKAELWAPEVHLYRGKYYLFLSILGKNGLRGTEISVSDTPDGLFVPIADRPATPLEQSCIDGTLFVDGDTPYIVYSHDWPDNYVPEAGAYVGQICALQLSPDLREPVGEPFLLFDSNAVPYSAKRPAGVRNMPLADIRYGSDAPFINRLQNGKLFLTWSPYAIDNYVVLGAIADDIRSPWEHLAEPIFDCNGGHAMFFTDLCGVRKMCIHQPERPPYERAMLLPVGEDENGLHVIE